MMNRCHRQVYHKNLMTEELRHMFRAKNAEPAKVYFKVESKKPQESKLGKLTIMAICFVLYFALKFLEQ